MDRGPHMTSFRHSLALPLFPTTKSCCSSFEEQLRLKISLVLLIPSRLSTLLNQIHRRKRGSCCFRRAQRVMAREERATAYRMRSRRARRTLLQKKYKCTPRDWVLRGKARGATRTPGHASNISMVYEGVVHDALPDTTDRQTDRLWHTWSSQPFMQAAHPAASSPKAKHPNHDADTTPQTKCLESLNEQN